MGDVQVPDNGLRTPLPDGVVVSFEPGTVARWSPAGKLASESAKWTQGFHVDLTDGEIDVTMPTAGKIERGFLVSSKAANLTVWRGRAHVTVRGDTTAVSVYEGSVVVGSGGKTFSVKDAGALVLHKAGEADKARLLPTVPRWDETVVPSSFAVAPEGSGAMLGIAWTPVPGAASYRVQLAEDSAMTRVVRSAAVGDARFVVAAPAQTGGPAGAGPTWTWAQVRAVGADGIIGDWSPPHALRVAHYRLPSGAFLAKDGVVVLPQGTSLPLLPNETEGIEVSYENVRPGPAGAAGTATPAPVLYWSKLTGPLRLPDDAPLRIVHLRDAALGVESRLAIAPREIRADVQMQPREAHAADPIEVRAVVWDPSGRVDVANEAVTLQAMVDLDPVAVAWQRTANVWTGRIGPRRNTGRPSIVRVVVRDGLAQEIGRGFVEVGR
jgi:hypothetical protein